MKSANKNSAVAIPIATALGKFTAHYSENGLAGLDFPGKGGTDLPVGRPATRGAPARPDVPGTGQIRAWHRLTEAALKNVLAGRDPADLPPLDWSGTTEFQQAVWRAMLKIPSGKTKSYGEIAAALGKPRAVRAVGGACGANPIPVLVPCHRVLAAHGKIGGFGSGLHWKRELLAREGVNPPPSAG